MHKYFVKRAEQITPSTLLLTLHKEDNSSGLFSFQPGQYVAISFIRKNRPTPARCFSIVSSPTEQDVLQLSMRTRGHFTKALAELKKDDKVIVRGPFGGFVFDQERDNNAIFIAGGIGITPFISMVRYATQLNLKNRITLLYSCQNQDDIPFLNELTKLKNENSNLRIIFVVSKGETNKLGDNEIHLGNINPELLVKVAKNNFKDKTFFMCGPPPFMRAMLKTLEEKGTPKSNLITEAFSQGANHQSGKVISWPINMYILSAVGVAAASFIVLLSDLIKVLPPSTIFDPNSINRKTALKNNRQADLDKLVNELPDQQNNAPSTNALTNALKINIDSNPQPQSINAVPTPSTAPKPSATPSPAPSAAPTPSATPTPQPAPQPKCTTTQSGVTTCI